MSYASEYFRWHERRLRSRSSNEWHAIQNRNSKQRKPLRLPIAWSVEKQPDVILLDRYNYCLLSSVLFYVPINMYCCFTTRKLFVTSYRLFGYYKNRLKNVQESEYIVFGCSITYQYCAKHVYICFRNIFTHIRVLLVGFLGDIGPLYVPITFIMAGKCDK